MSETPRTDEHFGLTPADAVEAHKAFAMTLERLLADALEIADKAARDLIVGECMGGYDWWDTRYAINGLGNYNEVDECDPINKALSYLDRRGLIERHPDNPNLVRFVDA